MSVNRELPHILVLPEDDANSQLANGFHLQVAYTRQRQMQVLPAANGWTHVLEDFLSDHIAEMARYPHRLMILLIDFDDDEERLRNARARIPGNLFDRVFILGSLSEPEALKRQLGNYEKIGARMAKDCKEGTDEIWGHDLLRHNMPELDRLREHVCSILFSLL